MKATVNRQEFADALSAVMPAVNARSKAEIVKYIKMVVDSDGLTLFATDTEIAIRYQFTGSIAHYQPGVMLMHPDRTAAIVRETASDTITISDGDGKCLRIESFSNWWNLPVPDSNHFPEIPDVADAEFMEIQAGDLREAIRRTIFAADERGANYALQSVCFDIRDDRLSLVATDAKRLAVLPVAVESAGSDRQALVSSRALKLLSHVLGGNDTHAKLSLRPNDALLKCGGATIYCRQNQGRFPGWRSVLPKDFEMTVNLPVDRVNRAVRQTMAVMNKEDSGVAFEFTPGKLCVTGEGKDVGLADIRFDVDADRKLGITFDARFVTEFLKQLKPDSSVTLRVKDSNSPVLFEADGDYQYVIMPLARD